MKLNPLIDRGRIALTLGIAFLTGAVLCASAASPRNVDLKIQTEWSAFGNGAFHDGIYYWGGHGREGAYTIALKRSGEAEYMITGAVKLPYGSSLQISNRDNPLEDDSKGSFSLRRVAKGRLTLDRAKTDGLPVDQSIPFRITVLKRGIDFVAGGLTHSIPMAPTGEGISLSIRGKGAEVSALEAVPLKTEGYYPVLAIAEKVNEKDSAFNLQSASLARGFLKSNGVLFYLPKEGVVDVSASMRGAREPLNNKVAFYLAESLKNGGRVVIKVPGDEYSALHLLAFSAGRPEHAQRMTVRIGYYGNGSAILEDAVVNVPTLIDGKTNAEVIASIPVKLAGGREGAVHHLRVPLAKTANVREFDLFDLEFTRDMNTHVMPPDPNIFGKIPVGLPSDVVVLGATLEPSPVTMSYTSKEPGNVFHDTQKVEFNLTLKNRSSQKRQVEAFAKVSGPGTGQEHGIEHAQWTKEKEIELAPNEEKLVRLDVSPGKRGWFSCKIGVKVDGVVVQERDTTFSVLAPDTRKAGTESPFGVWEFWRVHSIRPAADQVDRLASLINKGGWRHTYGGVPSMVRMDDDIEREAVYARLREQYKINFTIQNLPYSYQRKVGWWNPEEFQSLVVPALARGMKNSDGYFKVLHESRSSLSLLRRFSEYLGGSEYDMPKAEQAALEKQMENVKKYSAALKAADPNAKIVLINDYPAFVHQYLKRSFPAELFDVIGIEGGMFLRSPERQPDWHSFLGLQHELRRSMKQYGYDKPIWTTEALYHPANDGALTLHEQATIYVREAVMALQLGVQRMAAAGIIKDPSSDYYWSNWGSAGFCYRDPEINPKPSYAAYAWLTQVLDQAKPKGKLETPNHSLHVVDFVKPDGAHVYVAWTANGIQKVSFEFLDGTTPEVRDFYGNLVKNLGEGIEVSPTPQYIQGAVVKRVLSAVPIEVKAAKADTLLLDFDQPDQLKPVAVPNPVLESAWGTPSFKGNIESQFVTEDGASALRLELMPDNDPRMLLPRYTEFALTKPIMLEGRPKEFVFRLKGNSGWGRMMFELVDAKGRVFTSTGNQYATATASDPRGFSFVNFEGWQTMRFPIVGMYPGKDQAVYWPDNYNWWASPAPEVADTPRQQQLVREKFDLDMKHYVKEMEDYQAALVAHQSSISASGDAPKRNFSLKEPVKPRLKEFGYRGLVPVDYPLTLTKIIVSMRPHILYLDEERPVVKQEIFIDGLSVTQPPDGE